MQLTLAQLFGEGANETTATLIIQKSAMHGLTPSQDNRAEQLLAAIVCNAHEQFAGVVADDLGNVLTSEDGTPVTYDNSKLYDSLVIEQWRTVPDMGKIIHTFLIHEFNLI